MFRYFTNIQVIILIGILISTSCSTPQKPPVLPKDCAVVMKIDLWELAKKGALYELIETPIYNELIKGIKNLEQEALIPYIENPFNAGIDITAHTYAFVARDDISESSLIGIRSKISNKKKFATLISEIIKASPIPVPILQKENISYFMAGQWILAWNKTDLIFLFQNNVEQRILLEKATFLAVEQNQGTNLNPHFLLSEKKNSDIAIWFNYNQFSEEIAQFQKYLIDIETPKEQYLHIYIDFVDEGINTTLQWRSPEINENLLKHLRKKLEENPQKIFSFFRKN